MPWGEILDWLQSNWLGLLTLFIVAYGTYLSRRLLRRSERDVSLQAHLIDDDGRLVPHIDVVQVGEKLKPFQVQLVVVNSGGSEFTDGRLTLTLPGKVEIVDAPEWEEDRANVLYSTKVGTGHAVACEISSVGRNERTRLPYLNLNLPDFSPDWEEPLGEKGETRIRLRWEVWSGEEGMGSDDLWVRIRLDRPHEDES